MTDALIEDVLRAADGDELAFARVCRHPEVVRLLRTVGGRLYAPGLTRDDFHQEARLGLLAAVVNWNAARGQDGFLGFAALVIKRRLMSVVKTAQRAKHQVVSYAADLDSPAPGAEKGTLADQVPGGTDPAEALLLREQTDALLQGIARLTGLERHAVEVLLSGAGYRGDKQIDNALQRARKKLRRAA